MTLEEFYEKIDTRYINFTNVIVKNSHSIRSNFKIINWNYDNQLQKSIMQTKQVNYFEAYKRLNTIEKFTSRQRNSGGVFRLNGLFNYNYKDSRVESIPFLNDKKNIDHSEKEIAEEIVRHYGNCIHRPKFYNLLSLENDNYTDETKKIAIESVKDTEYLNIIGYSFPLINVGTDREILNSMEKLEKVYIQSYEPENIKRAFNELYKIEKDVKIETISPDKFYIPRDTI